MSFSKPFPLDIMDSIAVLSITQARDAKNFALVHRDLKHNGQKYLYSKVFIDQHRVHAAALSDFFESFTHILPYVRVLIIDLFHMRDLDTVETLMRRVIAVGRVHTLTLSRVPLVDPSTEFIFRLLPAFRTVNIDGCLYDGDCVARLITAASSVTRLVLGAKAPCRYQSARMSEDVDDGPVIWLKDVDACVQRAVPSRLLTRFTYMAEWRYSFDLPATVYPASVPTFSTNNWAEHAYNTLLAQPSFLIQLLPRIRSLTNLELLLPSALSPYLDKVLYYAGPSLIELDLTVIQQESWPIQEPCVNLVACLALKRFTYHDRREDMDSTLSTLLVPDGLHFIRLRINVNDVDFRVREWDQLKDALARDGLLKRSAELIVDMYTWFDEDAVRAGYCTVLDGAIQTFMTSTVPLWVNVYAEQKRLCASYVAAYRREFLYCAALGLLAPVCYGIASSLYMSWVRSCVGFQILYNDAIPPLPFAPAIKRIYTMPDGVQLVPSCVDVYLPDAIGTEDMTVFVLDADLLLMSGKQSAPDPPSFGCKFPQEIIDSIIWEVGPDRLTLKMISISSKHCVRAAQGALFEYIRVNSRRPPDVWNDVFQTYPHLASYVTRIYVRELPEEWGFDLDGLVRCLSGGLALKELRLSSVMLRPVLHRMLVNVWPMFPAIVFERCSLTEDMMRDMLACAVRLSTLCIGLGDCRNAPTIQSVDYGIAAPAAIPNVPSRRLTSFFYIMEIGRFSFLHSGAYLRHLMPLLGELRSFYARADYCVKDSIQDVIDQTAATLELVNVLFICRSRALRHPLNLRSCLMLSVLHLGEDIRFLSVLIAAFNTMPDNNRLTVANLHLHAPLAHYDAEQWGKLRRELDNAIRYPYLRILNIELYVFSGLEVVMDWVAAAVSLTDVWNGSRLHVNVRTTTRRGSMTIGGFI